MDNFQEIDIHLQRCIDMGYNARLNGFSKYENEFEPGSLSFDAWDAGYNMPDNYDKYLSISKTQSKNI